jgi:hypothetical protein
VEDPFGPVVQVVRRRTRVVDGREPEPAVLADVGQHVEHDARAAPAVEVEPVRSRDLDEILWDQRAKCLMVKVV